MSRGIQINGITHIFERINIETSIMSSPKLYFQFERFNGSAIIDNRITSLAFDTSDINILSGNFLKNCYIALTTYLGVVCDIPDDVDADLLNISNTSYDISKYTLLQRLKKVGIITQFIAFIKSDEIIYELWSAATILKSDNPMVLQISDTLKNQLGLTDEQVGYLLASGDIV